MTERQVHLCRILADPVSRSPDLHPADRAAIAAALAEIDRLSENRPRGVAAMAMGLDFDLHLFETQETGREWARSHRWSVAFRVDSMTWHPKAAPGEREG